MGHRSGVGLSIPHTCAVMIINQDDDGLVSKVGEGGGKTFAHFIRAAVTNISALL
jgi:hypothetical protein